MLGDEPGGRGEYRVTYFTYLGGEIKLPSVRRELAIRSAYGSQMQQ
jgi:hypothetical protein